MNHQLQHLAFVLGGQLGAITTQIFAMPVSASTLLRLTRSLQIESPEEVRILGIDDWAKRKRLHYGTILVDLERHQVIDLLPDRLAETLSKWLRNHPEVELITRDRWKHYADAVNSTLPEAIHVADRFHLIRNLVDALKRLFDRKGKCLRQAARDFSLEQQIISAETATDTNDITPAFSSSFNSWQELRFEEVKILQAQGVSKRAIARQLRIHRSTVDKYFELDAYPPRPATPQTTLRAASHFDFLMRRWKEGKQSYKALFRELVERFDYQGSYTGVCRAMNKWVKDGTLSRPNKAPHRSIPRLSSRSAAWLLAKDDDKLKDDKRRLRSLLCEKDETITIAYELARSFCKMVRQRLSDELENWLVKAKKSGIRELKNFAGSLQRDLDAVQAALIYEWSNGQVEGQVHRLKLIRGRCTAVPILICCD